MFDLFRSRDKSVRILLTAILSLVTLSMIGYLIPGYGGSGSTANDNVVAEVGPSTITVREVQNAIQAATRSQEMPASMLAHYIPQMIQQMITEKAMVYEAGRMGIQVSEADTAKAIRDQNPNLFPNGQFVGKEAYAAMLAQRDVTIPQFEQSMADQLILNRFRSIALESTVVSQADIEHEFRQMGWQNVRVYMPHHQLPHDWPEKSDPGKWQMEGIWKGKPVTIGGIHRFWKYEQ